MAEWIVEYRGARWTSEELTAAEAAVICVAAGRDDWTVLEPDSGPGALLANVVALAACRGGLDLDAARELVAAEKVADLLDCLTLIRPESPADQPTAAE